MLTMFLGLNGILHIICTFFIVNLMKCPFLLISCCSVFLLIFDTFPLEILKILLNLQFSVLNLPFFKYKDKERKIWWLSLSLNWLCFRICCVRIRLTLFLLLFFFLHWILLQSKNLMKQLVWLTSYYVNVSIC